MTSNKTQTTLNYPISIYILENLKLPKPYKSKRIEIKVLHIVRLLSIVEIDS